MEFSASEAANPLRIGSILVGANTVVITKTMSMGKYSGLVLGG